METENAISNCALIVVYVYQMEDIKLPMKHGSMEDISQEGDVSSQQESSVGEGIDSMSSQGQKAIYEREARIVLNYDVLDDDYKDVST